MTNSPNSIRAHSIQESARLSGLPESTLRFYEKLGLIPPVHRDASSRHRRYSETDLDAVLLVSCLNATGMSIDDMRQHLAIKANYWRAVRAGDGQLIATLTHEANGLAAQLRAATADHDPQEEAA
jgi:DNA-binding transcriptional MerR regulator